MLFEGGGAIRDFARLHEITSVLIRHGLGDLVRRAGIGGLVERAGQILHWRPSSEFEGLDPPRRVRLALEELGPTFVKLGQMLSTREDLFPPEWIAEFEHLQSGVDPDPFERLVPQLEKALGASPFDVFTALDTKAIACASIAQVHRAKLPDGTDVVLKIRRPGIRSKIEADLRILRHIATLIESELPEARRYRPTQILAELSRSLERELDLAVEARNMDRFAKNFADDPNVVLPAVYHEWTSEVMNVQAYVDAIRGNDAAAIEAAGLDRRILAARGAEVVLKMILVDGFFHADPHPGNVLYLPGNRVVLIDCGMVGRLTPSRRHQLVELLAAIARRDEEAMLDVVLEWSGEALVDEQRLAQDLGELVFDYADLPLKEVVVATLLRKVAAIMREHALMMPTDLTLLFKALVTLEGLGRQYDPEFRLVDHLQPFLERAGAERYQPQELFRRGRQGANRLYDLATSVPRDIARIVKEARRGRIRVDLDLKRLDDFGRKLDSTIDRITIGIMTASLVVGSSIVMTVTGGPQLFGVAVLTWLGLLGYLIAFVNSVWIIVAIWRSRRE